MARVLPHPPGPDVLRELLDERDGLRISIYVPLPENRGFDEVHDFPASYELAAKAAVKKLGALGASKAETDAARTRLLDVDADMARLPRETKSLGVFAGPEGLHAYALAGRVDRHSHAGHSYRVRPLLQAARLEIPYRVLALSTNHVSLFEGDVRDLHEVEAKDMPKSLKEALGSELSKGTLQYHSSANAGQAVIFHGQVDANQGRAVDQERFHRIVGKSAVEHWRDREDPLVLATEPANAASLRKVVDLPRLLERNATGNPDKMSPRQLHEQTWPIVRSWEEEQHARSARRALDALGRGLAISQINEVVEAATAGRVNRLWVDGRQQEPGRIDPTTGRATEGRGDEDLLDELACLVRAKGGEVIVCNPEELPDACTTIAELRG